MKHIFSLVSALMIFVVVTGCTQTNEPPTARILEPSNNTRFNDLTVTFKAEASDPEDQIKETTWYFGDGTQESGGSEITHTYNEAGTYTVRYTVLDDQDQDDTSSINITINAAPRAAARASAEVDGQTLNNLKAIKGNAPLEVAFQGSASRDTDGEIVSYHWDFGNGTTSDEADPTIVFESSGVFEAVLTVTDAEGATSQDRVKLEILPETVAITDVIEDAAPADTALIRGSTIGVNDFNKTVLYSYRMTTEGPFTEKQVTDTLIQGMLNLAQQLDISRATIYLFTELKRGFTDPGDYDHYLGMADWERPASDADLGQHIVNNTTINLNTQYFAGTAPTVLPYSLENIELEPDDPRCTICPEESVFWTRIILNPVEPTQPGNDAPAPTFDPVCEQEATATIQAIVQRALLLPGAYGLNIFETNADSIANGIAIGLWGARTDISTYDPNNALLFAGVTEEDNWDIDGDDFKFKFTKELPAC